MNKLINKKNVKRDSKKKMHWTIVIVLTLVCIMGIAGILYIKNQELKPTVAALTTKNQITLTNNSIDFKFNCSKERSCDNCSFFISCVDMISIDQGHNIYAKIKNQKNKQIDCLIRLSVNAENTILADKTYKIGIIQQNASKSFILPYNYSIEKTEFHITPLCI